VHDALSQAHHAHSHPEVSRHQPSEVSYHRHPDISPRRHPDISPRRHPEAIAEGSPPSMEILPLRYAQCQDDNECVGNDDSFAQAENDCIRQDKDKAVSFRRHPEMRSIEESPPLGFALAQLQHIYILAENADGLVMVDMHAAHERILYEQMKQSFVAQQIATQTLLIPLTLAVSEREADKVEEQIKLFQQVGFIVERIAKETITVREVPQLLAQGPIEQLIRDMIADIMLHETSTRAEKSYSSFIRNACLS